VAAEASKLVSKVIDAARAAGDRALELQGRNWLVTDLWELGEIAAWRAEVARHGALADELRLPAFSWYAPLWAAVDALHAGRFEEGARLRAAARAAGERAGERNTDVFAKMLVFQEGCLSGQWAGVVHEFALAKISGSPASMAYRAGYAWMLAASGDVAGAREQLEIVARDDFAGLAFDTNWPSAVGEAAETVAILRDAELAARLYEMIAPYAGRPLTAGRAIASYGMADRHLGLLAGVLGRHGAAAAHLEAAIALDGERGMRPWVVQGRLALAEALEATGEHERAAAERARARAEARELGMTAFVG
jgi:hypothetical protein